MVFSPRQHHFESRLFGQLEYCSIFTTLILYQSRDKKSRLLLALYQFYDRLHFLHDPIVIFPSVGDHAVGAILDALFGISEIATTIASQGIQGAIAKQAAEVFPVFALMAGKIFAGTVLEKIIICHSLTPLI